MDLFELGERRGDKGGGGRPLAERLRPQEFSDFLGQEGVLGPGTFLGQALGSGQSLPNLILWGPPGSGKTSFAHILSRHLKARFLSVNAVDTGAKRLREIGQASRQHRLQYGESTFLFIDEIHRLNKAQQDVLLPFTESGDLTLIGATTENPSYELNRALLSRCKVILFERLTEGALKSLLDRACLHYGLPVEGVFSEEGQELLCRRANGDARQLLNLAEQILGQVMVSEEVSSGPYRKFDKSSEEGESQPKRRAPLSAEQLEELLGSTPLYYDKSGDEHYDCASALIKSIRGSDPDAAIYYLARMLAGGEDPLFIARRLVILASEDVGNADPRALSLAVAGFQAVELVGLPEGAINLAQVTTYLASAPKSNRAYMALKKAQSLVQQTGQKPIPKSLRSAQTALSRELGFGEGYKYSHDGPTGWVSQEFFPEGLEGSRLYEPSSRGFEAKIREYLDWMKGSLKA